MKKLLLFLAVQTIVLLSLKAQTVSDYSYKFDNGITIKTDHCWSHVWVQQTYAPLAANNKTPLVVDIRILGDLISKSAYVLLSSGKEVKVQDAAPGTYQLKLNFKLADKPGTLSFIVNDIIIKPKTKTSVSITLYDYQILVSESPEASKGLAAYETQVNRCKSCPAQSQYFGVPSFF